MPICSKCVRTAKTICKDCRRCGRCRCTCVVCEVCSANKGRPVRHPSIVTCPQCGVCRRACDCHRRAPGQVLPSTDLPSSFGGSHLVNKINRAVSVEVELNRFAGIDRYAFQNFTYHMVGDRSVAGSEQEMVISGLQGDNVVKSMVELAAQMEINGTKHDDTCGFHVHVDTRDLSWWNIRALAILWEKFAKEIAYPYLHPDRVGNETCSQLWTHPKWSNVGKRLVSASSSGDIKRCVYELCGVVLTGNYENDINALDKLKRSKYGLGRHDPSNLRYYDLNLFSHVYRGTVEFRSMHMTAESLELVAWPLTCLNLVTLSTSKGEQWLKSCTMADVYKEMPAVVKVYLAKKTGLFKETKVCAA